MRIIGTLIVFVVFYVLEKSAYDVMASPNGSAAGLFTMVFLGATGIGILGFVWSFKPGQKDTDESPVRPLKH
ncbi:hypothetical protein A3K01_01140 [candidate division WWE3 bacterium RIFOXYD1_FULL_43_17]|uniref:Uncharacterized protein n=2 Tax=Katanobacteria TaxID=422282 RepID=A0A1F4XB22_UNCKA|nr:MAG: hypothetical protein UU59_C0004G0018 [candidate division WWE3 bacterium GW2011_GWE1_41_27]OGC78910.1 MAG: hypothetical protein A3K01_01140 [candidate division WWE3 bacterium RIFOXYD1_FULL_43_17]